MKITKSIAIVFYLINLSFSALDISHKGYLKQLQNVSFVQLSKNISQSQYWTHRSEIEIIAWDSYSLFWSFKNQLHVGDLVKYTSQYSKYFNQGNDYVDLSWKVKSGDSYVLNHLSDRLYLDWSNEFIQITIGRQRINWGKNLIWNPNDIFNQYNPIDIDNEERNGVDAARLQWYTGPTSALEVVYRHQDELKELSFGLLYKLSFWDYDWQVLSGATPLDYSGGTGFSGSLAGAAIRGEMIYLIPRSEDTTNNSILLSLSSDYMFTNEFYIQGSFFWNSQGKQSPII